MGNSMEFHGIRWNSMEFYETEVDGIPWKIPWNSMEFHGNPSIDEILWNSVLTGMTITFILTAVQSVTVVDNAVFYLYCF
jgi:hypothetical protein